MRQNMHKIKEFLTFSLRKICAIINVHNFVYVFLCTLSSNKFNNKDFKCGGIFYLICIVKLSPIGTPASVGFSPSSYT